MEYKSDDEPMVFEMDKLKRAPPKGIGIAPPKRKKNTEDEEMKNEEPQKAAAPETGPPTLSSSRPKAVEAPARGLSAPQIQDEDPG